MQIKAGSWNAVKLDVPAMTSELIRVQELSKDGGCRRLKDVLVRKCRDGRSP